LAFADATRKYIEAGKDLTGKGFDPRKLLAPGTEAIKQVVREKLTLFGSVNKALRRKGCDGMREERVYHDYANFKMEHHDYLNILIETILI
jgi:hypothetical protein